MDERMVQDLLKEGLAFLKEQSVLDFIKNDQAYQESSEAHGKAEKQYIEVKPHMNKFTCFLVPPGGGSPLGRSDSLSTIGPELSHLTAVKPPGPRPG